MHTDLQLLSRYHQRGDALAFRELMQSHAGMVLATARRITRDGAMAEDVVQETFLQLARQSQQITESVAAWLHRVAWRRACNAVRDDATRRRHEDAAGLEAVSTGQSEASWSEVESVLDAVINELPDNLRAPLVMHFLEGRSQREIAKELRVSQSTVSRAIESGLAELRAQLRSKGVLCGAGLGIMLAALGSTASAATVPAALITSLSKLGMSGIGGIGAGGAVVGGLALSAKLMLGAGLLVVAVSAAVGLGKTSNAAAGAPNKKLASNASAPAAIKPAFRPVINRGHATTPAVPAIANGAPAHELVHSFPLPARRPSGHIVRDSDGWIWGIFGSGGNYGLGGIYKMRPDGSDWQEMVSFNGITGLPRGTYPRGGVMMTPDGALWGTTTAGGGKNEGTLYRYDPKAGAFDTIAEFQDVGRPWVPPTLAPDGQLWGPTSNSVYRFNPATGQMATVFKFTGRGGAHPGARIQGELVADGLGYLWGVAETGGANDLGVIYKINIASAETTTVAEFTGKAGACVGARPIPGLTLDNDGFLWGTTRNGGGLDWGTVFKVQARTGVLVSVAEFNARADDNPGANPETMLVADGAGNLWGTTSGGGALRYGTVFKVNAQTGALRSVVNFTGLEGDIRGGPAHGHLFNDGAGGLIGACDSGGAVGTVFRVDIATGRYTQLTDICRLVMSNEGCDLHGTLAAGSGDWLWGMSAGGLRQYGTIYKFNAVTNELVTVVDFTGTAGPNKGRNVDAGLVSDGHGFLWGNTTSGGAADLGTVFKVEESTGAFTTVAESMANPESGLAPRPTGALVADGKGFMWGTTVGTIYKINMSTSASTTVAKFNGDQKPPHGSAPLGTLALDDNGFLWGCSQAARGNSRACLFKIDTRTDAFITLAEFTDANGGWSYGNLDWHPAADMYWDGKGCMWFTGVIDTSGARRQCSLIKVNTRTNMIEGRYMDPNYRMISAPVMDENGLLWGGVLNGGMVDNGSLYTFDIRTQKFVTAVSFTGQGAQARTGQHLHVASLMKHRDGNFYGITRVGGPGNGGTVYRLRYGPTPMTQEATVLADGNVILHGTLTPNGLDSNAAFQWGTEPKLADAATLDAGRVTAGHAARPVSATLSGLKAATTYYFRLCGSNGANPIPQRGAVLSFTTPAPKADTLVAGALAGGKSGPGQTDDIAGIGLTKRKFSLSVNQIPGAGAGFVKGGLTGAAYEIGGQYSLTALADNDYIFHHWSGPGIGGAQAEKLRLNFVFTEELAQSPMITATFVRNPFRGEAIGSFNGLVLAAEGVTPDITNTGALRLNITDNGSFSAILRYDGDVIPVLGAFDSGGLARFGPDAVSSWVLKRDGKPDLLVALQLDLGATGPHEVCGNIASVNGADVVVQSTVNAARGYYDGLVRTVPSEYLNAGGIYSLLISGTAPDEMSGTLNVTAAGSAIFAVKLGDGTNVLAQAPLSQANQASLFSQLYVRQTGSVGGQISLDALLPKAETNAQPFWWCRPNQPWLDLHVRSSAAAQ